MIARIRYLVVVLGLLSALNPACLFAPAHDIEPGFGQFRAILPELAPGDSVRLARGATVLGDALPAVFANPYSLEEVVVNLVTNARDAVNNQNSSGRSSVNIRTDLDSEGLVRICVSDNGSGIPADLIERVWEPFFTTKGPDRGTGLGLSICRSIVEQSSGRLVLESEVGRGTSVTVLLPRHDGEDEQPAAETAV